MAHHVTLSTPTFDPAALTHEQKARLEQLLNTLDAAVEKRKKQLLPGQIKAFAAYFKNPKVAKRAKDYVAMFNVIADDRFTRHIDDVEKASSTDQKSADVIAKIKSLPLAQQKEAVGFAGQNANQYIDMSMNRKSWKEIDGLYDQILQEFPGILFTQEDLESSKRFGEALDQVTLSLGLQWNSMNGPQRMEKIRALLAYAHPNDDVPHLHIEQVKIKKAIAAYMTSTGVDTMLYGDMVAKQNASYGFSLFVIAHEFQHRRQLRLVDRLKKGELAEGSANYYQARLFRANFNGGYLSPMTKKTKLGMIAGIKDYGAQPVERQANANAALINAIAGTGGDKMGVMMEKINNGFSSIARPFNNAACAVQQAARAVASIGRKKPKPE